ncbi:unnamed protein product [Cladocopium goreaui]|uniref:Uncharacterized protein n=1 Tax=Cladocopium goreaui TaxID=2562237 RepID=A0A9P1DC66_9DINO|nr:unnamed protein product [Cladocopium goreaui]
MPLQAQQLGENDDVQLAALFAQRRRLDEGARQEFFSRVMSDAETKATKGGRRKRRPPRPRAAAEATTSSPDVNLSEESQPGRGRSPFVSPRPRPAAMEGLEALLTLKRRAPLLSQEVEGLLLELSKPMVPEAEAACCRLLQRCTESARFAREAVAEGAEEELSEMDTESVSMSFTLAEEELEAPASSEWCRQS